MARYVEGGIVVSQRKQEQGEDSSREQTSNLLQSADLLEDRQGSTQLLGMLDEKFALAEGRSSILTQPEVQNEAKKSHESVRLQPDNSNIQQHDSPPNQQIKFAKQAYFMNKDLNSRFHLGKTSLNLKQFQTQGVSTLVRESQKLEQMDTERSRNQESQVQFEEPALIADFEASLKSGLKQVVQGRTQKRTSFSNCRPIAQLDLLDQIVKSQNSHCFKTAQQQSNNPRDTLKPNAIRAGAASNQQGKQIQMFKLKQGKTADLNQKASDYQNEGKQSVGVERGKSNDSAGNLDNNRWKNKKNQGVSSGRSRKEKGVCSVEQKEGEGGQFAIEQNLPTKLKVMIEQKMQVQSEVTTTIRMLREQSVTHSAQSQTQTQTKREQTNHSTKHMDNTLTHQQARQHRQRTLITNNNHPNSKAMLLDQTTQDSTCTQHVQVNMKHTQQTQQNQPVSNAVQPASVSMNNLRLVLNKKSQKNTTKTCNKLPNRGKFRGTSYKTGLRKYPSQNQNQTAQSKESQKQLLNMKKPFMSSLEVGNFGDVRVCNETMVDQLGGSMETLSVNNKHNQSRVVTLNMMPGQTLREQSTTDVCEQQIDQKGGEKVHLVGIVSELGDNQRESKLIFGVSQSQNRSTKLQTIPNQLDHPLSSLVQQPNRDLVNAGGTSHSVSQNRKGSNTNGQAKVKVKVSEQKQMAARYLDSIYFQNKPTNKDSNHSQLISPPLFNVNQLPLKERPDSSGMRKSYQSWDKKLLGVQEQFGVKQQQMITGEQWRIQVQQNFAEVSMSQQSQQVYPQQPVVSMGTDFVKERGFPVSKSIQKHQQRMQKKNRETASIIMKRRHQMQTTHHTNHSQHQHPQTSRKNRIRPLPVSVNLKRKPSPSAKPMNTNLAQTTPLVAPVSTSIDKVVNASVSPHNKTQIRQRQSRHELASTTTQQQIIVSKVQTSHRRQSNSQQAKRYRSKRHINSNTIQDKSDQQNEVGMNRHSAIETQVLNSQSKINELTGRKGEESETTQLKKHSILSDRRKESLEFSLQESLDQQIEYQHLQAEALASIEKLKQQRPATTLEEGKRSSFDGQKQLQKQKVEQVTTRPKSQIRQFRVPMHTDMKRSLSGVLRVSKVSQSARKERKNTQADQSSKSGERHGSNPYEMSDKEILQLKVKHKYLIKQFVSSNAANSSEGKSMRGVVPNTHKRGQNQQLSVNTLKQEQEERALSKIGQTSRGLVDLKAALKRDESAVISIDREQQIVEKDDQLQNNQINTETASITQKRKSLASVLHSAEQRSSLVSQNESQNQRSSLGKTLLMGGATHTQTQSKTIPFKFGTDQTDITFKGHEVPRVNQPASNKFLQHNQDLNYEVNLLSQESEEVNTDDKQEFKIVSNELHKTLPINSGNVAQKMEELSKFVEVKNQNQSFDSVKMQHKNVVQRIYKKVSRDISQIDEIQTKSQLRESNEIKKITGQNYESRTSKFRYSRKANLILNSLQQSKNSDMSKAFSDPQNSYIDISQHAFRESNQMQSKHVASRQSQAVGTSQQTISEYFEREDLNEVDVDLIEKMDNQEIDSLNLKQICMAQQVIYRRIRALQTIIAGRESTQDISLIQKQNSQPSSLIQNIVSTNYDPIKRLQAKLNVPLKLQDQYSKDLYSSDGMGLVKRQKKQSYMNNRQSGQQIEIQLDQRQRQIDEYFKFKNKMVRKRQKEEQLEKIATTVLQFTPQQQLAVLQLSQMVNLSRRLVILTKDKTLETVTNQNSQEATVRYKSRTDPLSLTTTGIDLQNLPMRQPVVTRPNLYSQNFESQSSKDSRAFISQARENLISMSRQQQHRTSEKAQSVERNNSLQNSVERRKSQNRNQNSSQSSQRSGHQKLRLSQGDERSSFEFGRRIKDEAERFDNFEEYAGLTSNQSNLVVQGLSHAPKRRLYSGKPALKERSGKKFINSKNMSKPAITKVAELIGRHSNQRPQSSIQILRTNSQGRLEQLVETFHQPQEWDSKEELVLQKSNRSESTQEQIAIKEKNPATLMMDSTVIPEVKPDQIINRQISFQNSQTNFQEDKKRNLIDAKEQLQKSRFSQQALNQSNKNSNENSPSHLDKFSLVHRSNSKHSFSLRRSILSKERNATKKQSISQESSIKRLHQGKEGFSGMQSIKHSSKKDLSQSNSDVKVVSYPQDTISSQENIVLSGRKFQPH